MPSLNKATIIGHLGNAPDTRYTTDGKAVCNITVATSESWKSKDGTKQEKTEWQRVVFFGKLAEIAGEYLKKGSLVYVEGQLTTRKWSDKDGTDRYTTEIVAREMKMLGGKPSSGEAHAKESQPAKGIPDDDGDSIPF